MLNPSSGLHRTFPIQTNIILCRCISRLCTRRTIHNSPHIRQSIRPQPWLRIFFLSTVLSSAAITGYLYYSHAPKVDTFTKYSLTAKEPVSSTASIFHLEHKSKSQNFEQYRDAWKRGIWNVHFKQPQLQIIRPYTPLPPQDGFISDGKTQLRFLVRQDPHGEVSTYLHRLPLGAEIQIRGPNQEYVLPEQVQQVLFFAGGTGIAPVLQIAHTMFNEQKNQPNESDVLEKQRKLHILWANRKREDCLGGVSDEIPANQMPPKSFWSGLFVKHKSKHMASSESGIGVIVKEIENLKRKYPGQITVEYFVNTEDTWINEQAVARALSIFDGRENPEGSQKSPKQQQILISGPSGFITYLAGPKKWKDGREEQGDISGIIANTLSKSHIMLKYGRYKMLSVWD